MASSFNKVVTNPGLKSLVLDVCLGGFAARGETLNIFPHDPLEPGTFPAVGINQTQDTEIQAHIGDSLADELDDAEDTVYAGESAIFSQAVEVRLWSDNADERDRLGSMLKEVLFEGRGTSFNPGLFLTTPGVGVVKITGGVDEGISDTSQEFAPYPVFMRTYQVSAQTELTLQEPAGPPLTDAIIIPDFYQETTDITL